ncbi:MAG: hypothetical protein J5I93_02145 [Pirellulaceae bacterium]|nr:hypothetical protein [Pirellulaceae bacterium]
MVSRKFVVLAAMLMGALLCTAAVDAQQRQPGGRGQAPGQGGPGGQGGRGFGFGGGGGFRVSVNQTVIGLARALPENEKLQKELDVLPEQVTDLKKYFDDQQANRQRPEFPQNFREMSEEERQKLFDNMRKDREKRDTETLAKVDEFLLPHQSERLREVALQIMGLTALQDTEIAGKLKISDEQKTKMETVQTEMGEQMRERMRAAFQGGNAGGADRDALRKQFEEFNKERETKVLAVLTSAQKADFEKMKGKPVELTAEERAALGRGGFGGFGGRGGAGGPGGRGPGGAGGPGGRGPGGPGGRPGGEGRPARPSGDNP